jgi:hypothetical protein
VGDPAGRTGDSDLERGINRTARKDTAELLAGALGLAEPARPVFVAAARGRAPAEEVLAALREAAAPEGPVREYAGRVGTSTCLQEPVLISGHSRSVRIICSNQVSSEPWSRLCVDWHYRCGV